MQAIYRGIQQMNALIPRDSEERLLTVAEDAATGLQTYVLKRMFSEASSGLTFFHFPSYELKARCVISVSHSVSQSVSQSISLSVCQSSLHLCMKAGSHEVDN